MNLKEFIRLNVDATQEHDPDLDQIAQRIGERWESDRNQMYVDGAADALDGVLAALGRGVSPSFVIAVVADELGIDLTKEGRR